jgi:type III pantothenate kinase
MNLVIDSGNSRIKAGFFEGRKLIRHKIFSVNEIAHLKTWAEKKQPETIFLSDVSGWFKSWKAKNLMRISYRLPLPISLRYHPKRSLGHDRIGNAAGAHALLAGTPVLIIDCGTALKMDLVAEGIFQGGSIAPGMSMRFDALYRHTAALPLVTATHNFQPPGNTTHQSIRSGVLFGMLGEMEGCIRFYKKHYRHLKVILTGGDGFWFINHLKYPIFVIPQLTLIGLNEILCFQK